MEKIKTTLTGLMAAIASSFGALVVPIILLVFCNVVDYTTGIWASKYRGEEISSYKGMKGIIKKISMWLLICIGVVLDMLITYTAQNIGIVVPFNYLVACLVAVWLAVNEIISILENLNDIGVPLPPFLMPIVNHLKSKVEEVGSKEEDNN